MIRRSNLPHHKNKPDNSLQYSFFELYCSMIVSRIKDRNGNIPREYCSAADERTIYNLLEKNFPNVLVIDGVKISEKEFISLIGKHMNTCREIIEDGYPVNLGSNFGCVGIQIQSYKKQLPSSRFKKDADKKFVEMPFATLYWSNKHLLKRISKNTSLSNLGIRLIGGTKHIIKAHLQDKAKYVLTGDSIHLYAKKINYDRYK